MSSSGNWPKVAAAAGAVCLAAYLLNRPINKSEGALKQDPTSVQKMSIKRRHSTGESAFLPEKQEVDALKTAKKGAGVQEGQVQDSEGTRLPTTRGY